MKVLMIIPSHFNRIGGAERQLYILKQKLIKRNLKIIILSNKKNSHKIIFLFKILYKILFRYKNIDLIHIHTINSPALIGSIAGKILSKPTIVKIPRNGKGSAINKYYRSFLGKLYLFILKKSANKFICLTNYAQKELISFGFNKKKLIVIPNGVKVENKLTFSKSKNKNNFICVGRLIKRKNVSELLSCFKIVFKNKKKKLFIIGNGPELNNLKEIDKKIISKSKALFFGNKSNIFVNKKLKKSLFFIMNSNSEGLSNAMLEAMSNKCVVIVRKLNVNVKILKDNYNSIIYKNERDLYLKLKNLDNNKRLKFIGNNALETVKKFYDINLITEKYIKLYKTLI